MLTIHTNHQLKPLNTMGIDGTVTTLAEWSDAADLHQLFKNSEMGLESNPSFKAIWQGSNILFNDYKVDKLLLRCVNESIEIVDEDETGVTLTVHAGCQLDRLVDYCCYQGWWGIENLSLIPGTIGGATVQNVGAYGTEWGDVVVEVKCYDTDIDRVVTIPRSDMAYGYRDSALKHRPLNSRFIVVSTTVRLSKIASPILTYGGLSVLFAGRESELTPVDLREEIIKTRRSKLPDVAITGSAGSFFKNPIVSAQDLDVVLSNAHRHGIDTSSMPVHGIVLPDGSAAVKLSAAWLIDKSGWKGYRRWNVGTWPGQPLVLVNITGYASGIEVIALASDIIADVKEKWGIELSPEVEYL